MSAHRREKISELLCHQLGEILLAEEEFGDGILVTVMGADTSSDLRRAKVFLSVFPAKHGPAILARLARRVGYFQKILEEKTPLCPAPKIELALSPIELNQSEKL